jgi:sensor histidine kinase YesM
MGGGLEIERVEKKRKIGKKIELTDQGTGIGEETKGIRRERREEPVRHLQDRLSQRFLQTRI